MKVDAEGMTFKGNCKAALYEAGLEWADGPLDSKVGPFWPDFVCANQNIRVQAGLLTELGDCEARDMRSFTTEASRNMESLGCMFFL